MTNEFEKRINKLLLSAVKAAMIATVGGLMGFSWDSYNDIKDLQAQDRVKHEKIVELQKKTESTEKKIDDLHWYFIKKNNVKVPSKTEKQ